MSSSRNLIACTLTAAVLGGAAGAGLTAATSTSASPAAIAAAVQRVRDTQATAQLAQIRLTLEAINTDLGGHGQTPPEIAPTVHRLLQQICRNTGGAIPIGCS